MIPGCKWWFGDSALDLVCLLQWSFEGFRPGDLGGCWLFSDLSYGFLLSWMFGQVSYWLPPDFMRFYELLVFVCWFSWVNPCGMLTPREVRTLNDFQPLLFHLTSWFMFWVLSNFFWSFPNFSKVGINAILGLFGFGVTLHKVSELGVLHGGC